jgi:YD repeat-containing protein
MAYNKGKDWITKFRDQDRMVTSYDYFADNLDPENKFGTTVARRREGGNETDTSKFWYEFRRRADGSRYNHKAVTLIRGSVTETIFTECCGTPLVISQWRADETPATSSQLAWIAPKPDKRSTSFEYFEDGLLKKKTAPDGTITALTYDAKHRKVSSVDKGGRKIQYNYDGRGNLAWAVDFSQKKRLDLTYDEKGRITIVKESLIGTKQGRTVFFRYDAKGKPVEIKEKTFEGREGLIKLAYGADGEVSGVFNAQGRAVASADEIASAQRIAATFQGLLEVVQPAGVTLTPEG